MQKAASLLILLFLLTAIASLLQEFQPNSAELALAGERASEEELQLLRERTGADKSFAEKMFHRFSRLITFDLGKSIYGESNSDLIFHALGTTVILALAASVFSLLYGFSAGYCALICRHLFTLLEVANKFLLALPVFVAGIVLIWVLSLAFPVFPAGGKGEPGWFILPAAALGLKSGARLYFFFVEFMKKEIVSLHIRTARALGIARRRILYIHALKNIFLPVISFWLLDLSAFLAGAAVIEAVFSLPGIGTLLLQSLRSGDQELMVSILVVVALLIFAVSLVQERLDRYYERFNQ